MGEDHRPGPGPLPSAPRAPRAPELWVVIEVPEPVRSEVLLVRRIISRTSQRVPVGIGSVGPLPPQELGEVRRILDAVGEETGPIIGRFVALRRFPQTRYVYLAPDDEMATSLLILQDRLVEYGLNLPRTCTRPRRMRSSAVSLPRRSWRLPPGRGPWSPRRRSG